jgi:hypothetical protein
VKWTVEGADEKTGLDVKIDLEATFYVITFRREA